MMHKITLFLSCLLFLSPFSGAQIGQSFWFAAPEVDQAHADRPIVLQLTSEDLPATVAVDIPASEEFPGPLLFELESEESITVDLTEWIDLIENTAADTVADKGIHITSDEQITAYYEVRGTSGIGVNNAEIYTLKGAVSLGTKFYTPFQTTYSNAAGDLDAWSSFDIVATEDNTEITITPGADIVGHEEGKSYTIVLNRGQTYSGRAVGLLPEDRPVGTLIESDKPVAVTKKDDSVLSGGWDLIGDQLIPVSEYALEYTVFEGDAYVMAGSDSTVISVNGEVQDTILNAGQQMRITTENGLFDHIVSNHPVTVFHTHQMGGNLSENEIAGAILPPMNCTGSDKINFVRTTDEPLFMFIIAKQGTLDDFSLNGYNVIRPPDFINIPGTNKAAAFIDASRFNDAVPEGEISVIQNSSAVFHFAMINGARATGNRYGYFSNFSTLNLTDEILRCQSDGQEVTLDAGIGRDSYDWSTGETTQTIATDTSGEFRVTISEGQCTESDTVFVNIQNSPEISLPEDTSYCEGDTLVLDPDSNADHYIWDRDTATAIREITSEGTYNLQAANDNGCSVYATTEITEIPLPVSFLTEDTMICRFDTLLLGGERDFGPSYEAFDYTWNNEPGEQFREFTEAQPIKVEVSNSCGGFSDTLQLLLEENPEITLPDDTTKCPSESLNLQAVNEANVEVEWTTASVLNNEFTPEEGGNYEVIATNDFGCRSSHTIEVVFLKDPEITLPNDTVVCDEEEITLQAQQGMDYYQWSTGEETDVITVRDSGRITLTQGNRCGEAEENIHVQFWNIETPNIFTPNDDGVNDAFVIEGLKDGKWHLNVHNRWGTVVYENPDYDNMWQAKGLKDGTYFFSLKQEEYCNEYKGWVVITR